MVISQKKSTSIKYFIQIQIIFCSVLHLIRNFITFAHNIYLSSNINRRLKLLLLNFVLLKKSFKLTQFDKYQLFKNDFKFNIIPINTVFCTTH